MPTHIVAVEWPCDRSDEERPLVVVVTDAVESLGPGLMAKVDDREVPIATMSGWDVKEAALNYIAEHSLEEKTGKIQVNTAGDFREWEWRTEPGWALVE